MDTLPVVTVSLRRGKKNRATIISRLTYLWDSGVTNITIRRKHNVPYEHSMHSNNVYYRTSAEL